MAKQQKKPVKKAAVKPAKKKLPSTSRKGLKAIRDAGKKKLDAPKSGGPIYLVKVSAMFTSEQADAVPSAEFTIAHGSDPAQLGAEIASMAATLTGAISGAPLKGLRPMTRDEIERYRDERDADDERVAA